MNDQNTTTVPEVKVRKAKIKGLPPHGRVFDAAALAVAMAACNGDVIAARIKLEAERVKGTANVVNIGNNAETVAAYVKGFNDQAPQEGSGGYTSFVTVEDAYTNKDMIESFGPQGVAKQLALLISRAAAIIIGGGDDATEMAAALEGINAYQKVAVDEARKASEQKAVDDALATLAKSFGGDMSKARAALSGFAQSNGITLPTAAVEPTDTAETLANSGGNIADDDMEDLADIPEETAAK